MKLKSGLMSIWNKIDYLDNFKLFDDVYGVLDTSYMMYIAFGMTPYTRSKSPKGRFIYYDMGWKKYGISTCKQIFFYNCQFITVSSFILGYSFLLLLAIALTVLKELESDSDSLDSIVNIYLVTQMVFSMFTLNIFAARANTLLKAYGNCYKADKTLKALGFKLDYKLIHKITLYGSLTVVFFGIMNLILYLLWRKTITEFIRFSFVYSFPCVVSVIPVYHFNYLGIVVLKRLRLINNYLAEDFSSVPKKQVELNLWAIAKVHSELCNTINNVLYSSAFSIATFYFFTYLQFSALILGAMDIVHLKFGIETYLWNVIYIATTVGILVVATLLKFEVCIILGICPSGTVHRKISCYRQQKLPIPSAN